jgi:hypothetical protein
MRVGPRCRGLAVERDDLSLLDAMTVKERAKYNAKGIFTIAQLSHGYRPRRRKRAKRPAESTKRATPAPRNDHKLKPWRLRRTRSIRGRCLGNRAVILQPKISSR